MAQLGRGSRVKLLHLRRLALAAENTVDLGQLARGFWVGMLQSLITVHQRQFAGDIPANLVHCADSPEFPGVMDKGRVRVETRIDPAPPGVITKGVLNLLSDRYWYRGEWIANWNLRA